MNTPLGTIGRKAQQARDDIESRFRKRYGVANHEPGTPDHLNALSKVHDAVKNLAEVKNRVEFAKRILGASGRTPAFG